MSSLNLLFAQGLRHEYDNRYDYNGTNGESLRWNGALGRESP